MKAIRNSFFLYIAYLWNFIGGFIQLKLLATDIDKALLGKYFFAGGLGILIGSLAQIGFPYIFQRYIPRYDHEKRKNDKLMLIWFALLFHIFILALSLFPVSFIFRHNLPMLLVYTAFYLVSHTDLFFNVYISQRKAEPVTLLKGIYFLVLTIMLIILRPLDLNRAAYSMFTASLFVLVLTYMHLPLPKDFTFKNIKGVFLEIKHYFLYSLYTHLLGPFFMYIDRIMIPPILGYPALSIFQIARKLEQGARGFLFVPISAFAPELAKLYEEENHEESKDILKKLTFVYGTAGLVIAVLFVVFAEPLIILVSNRAYVSAAPHLKILMASFGISLFYAPYTTYRRSQDGMDFFFKVNAVWLLSFLLYIPFTIKHLGLFAFSSGFLFATLIVAFFCILDFRSFQKQVSRL